MNAQAMRPNEWPQSERTKAANERTDNIMYERNRKNKPNNQTSEMPAKQTENGSIERTSACKPGTQQMAEIQLFFIETKEKTLGQYF